MKEIEPLMHNPVKELVWNKVRELEGAVNLLIHERNKREEKEGCEHIREIIKLAPSNISGVLAKLESVKTKHCPECGKKLNA